MSAIENLSPEQQREVRTRVRGLLERSAAFGQLEPDKQKEIASGLVNVVGYLADPAAVEAGLQGCDLVLHCAGPFSATSAPICKSVCQFFGDIRFIVAKGRLGK